MAIIQIQQKHSHARIDLAQSMQNKYNLQIKNSYNEKQSSQQCAFCHKIVGLMTLIVASA